MRVLLTGASSFTGFWFAQSLTKSGATIVAPIRGRVGDYDGVRAVRVSQLVKHIELVENVSFGSSAFLALASQRSFDVLCHHAARVSNYRSLDFDVIAAITDNTLNLRRVLEALKANGLKAVIATGSAFEQDEGIGDPPHRAFSPYGLSKGLTWQVVRFWCAALSIPLGKFVIANPFGPYEEPRFGAYLLDQWRAGRTAEVRTPLYLRDNIHVDLLALAYNEFVRKVVADGRDAKLGVSGYRETQGAFARRLAAEMRPRLGLECRLALAHQTDFGEPMVRLNSDAPDAASLGWDERKAWDSLAHYYREPSFG